MPEETSVSVPEDEMGYLSTNQIGAILGFQGRAIREMCRKGEIPSIEVGGEYRVEKRVFRDWLEKRSVKPKDVLAQAE